jgi:hypothetical protein
MARSTFLPASGLYFLPPDAFFPDDFFFVGIKPSPFCLIGKQRGTTRLCEEIW